MGEVSNKAKGRIKQAVGGLVGNKALKKEGEADERKAKVEAAVGDVKHGLKGAVRDAKHALKEVSK